MPTEKCPDCGGTIPIPEDSVLGEIVECPDCGLEFEVVEKSGSRIVLREVLIEREDWGE